MKTDIMKREVKYERDYIINLINNKTGNPLGKIIIKCSDEMFNLLGHGDYAVSCELYNNNIFKKIWRYLRGAAKK